VSGERETELSETVRSRAYAETNIEVRYFPSRLPELNAVEGCWDQLQEWFKYRLVPDLSTLKDYISRGVNTISTPSMWSNLTGKDPT
jgi:hypothetical protein